jgi:hypothetical protein
MEMVNIFKCGITLTCNNYGWGLEWCQELSVTRSG